MPSSVHADRFAARPWESVQPGSRTACHSLDRPSREQTMKRRCRSHECGGVASRRIRYCWLTGRGGRNRPLDRCREGGSLVARDVHCSRYGSRRSIWLRVAVGNGGESGCSVPGYWSLWSLVLCPRQSVIRGEGVTKDALCRIAGGELHLVVSRSSVERSLRCSALRSGARGGEGPGAPRVVQERGRRGCGFVPAGP
jgi:hypothetical protein